MAYYSIFSPPSKNTMSRIITIMSFLLFLHYQSIAQHEKLIEATNSLVESINNNDFKSFNKNSSFLLRTLVRKSLRKELFESLRAEGRWILTDDIQVLDPTTSMFGMYLESDTKKEEQFVKLFFSKKYRLSKFNISEHNIVYPSVSEVTSIDDIVKPYMNFENNSGLAIGIFHNGKKEFFEYGALEKGENNKPDSNSLFQIGSISKVFTGMLLAQMHTRKELSIYQNVNSFLPNEIPTLGNKSRNVQLIDLATHSSRLVRDFDPGEEGTYDEDNPFVAYHRAELYDILKHTNIDKKLGKEYEYSNVGMGLLGLILSDHHGKSYEQTLGDYLLKPLNMENTMLFVPKNNLNKATSYSWGEKVPDLITNDAMQAAGGIYSCTNDMLKLIENIIEPQDASLKVPLDLATQIHFQGYETMGLGWMHDTFLSEKYLLHEGNTPGSSSMIMISKEHDFGIIVLGNSSVPVDQLAKKIAGYYLSKGGTL